MQKYKSCVFHLLHTELTLSHFGNNTCK